MKRLRILVLEGPNLNLLGRREPEVYGSMTMNTLHEDMKRLFAGTAELVFMQSNSEGVLVSAVQAAGVGPGLMFLNGALTYTDPFDSHPGIGAIMAAPVDGIVLNAGGYTHTSVALHDAVASICIPVVEVHISDIYDREPFRHRSYLTDVCAESIIGHGTDGYFEAVRYIIDNAPSV